MKLHLVPARTGLQWVKLGMRTFLKQPLALTGLFLMYMLAAAVASAVPLLGAVMAVVIGPAATVGMMEASSIASQGRFPMPPVLLTAFRAGRQRSAAVLLLGVAYFVVLFALALAINAGLEPAGEPPATGGVPLGTGVVVMAILQIPLLVLFSLAPALVRWHGFGAAKSLFFSAIALWRNAGAFATFWAAWMAVCLLVSLVVALLFGLFGVKLGLAAVAPMVLPFGAAITASMYFPFHDCFAGEPGSASDTPSNTGESTP